jgi:hypothetical protein
LIITSSGSINEVFSTLFLEKVSFEKIEEIVKENKKLTLEGDELFYIRAFYEHAIENWSCDNYDGAKNFIFILTQIIDDEKLVQSLNMHLVMCSQKTSLDKFYETYVNIEGYNENESHGYFIMNYKIDIKSFLKEKQDILDTEYKNLKHLMD